MEGGPRFLLLMKLVHVFFVVLSVETQTQVRSRPSSCLFGVVCLAFLRPIGLGPSNFSSAIAS